MTGATPMTENQGITIIQRFDPAKRIRRRSKVALVLAGGAVAGGGYKLGGLRALEDCFLSRVDGSGRWQPFTLNDFDTYVGLSAGSLLAASLAAGLTMEDMFGILTGTSKKYTKFLPRHFMRPNFSEPIERMGLFAAKEWEVLANFLAREIKDYTGRPFTLGETLIKALTVLPRLVPTGFFDTAGIERFFRRNAQLGSFPLNFEQAYRKTGKELYITAVNLDDGEKVVFGHDAKYRDVPVSQAVAASCGLPVWYRTVRIKNPRYGEPGEPRYLALADGGIVRTANVQLAIDRGADLVICYNPFRRIRYDKPGRSLYEHGLYAVISQVFRIVLGSRLDISKHWFAHDESINADIIYIEPSDDDFLFFLMNPLNFWGRQKAAEHGFVKVRRAIDANFPLLRSVFATHGIKVSRKVVDLHSRLLREAHHRDGEIRKIMGQRHR